MLSAMYLRLFTLVDITLNKRHVARIGETALILRDCVNNCDGHAASAIQVVFMLLKGMLSNGNIDDASGKHTIALTATGNPSKVGREWTCPVGRDPKGKFWDLPTSVHE